MRAALTLLLILLLAACSSGAVAPASGSSIPSGATQPVANGKLLPTMRSLYQMNQTLALP
ncbi:MAG TPA: hypothetical protein VFA50_10275 [Stellaceae bacterium]|nr:hypothetical protein [Stellaceae bacterium]